MLSKESKNVFIDIYKGDLSVESFERWVYESPQLEHEVGTDNYLELVEFNYKQPHARNELFNIVSRYVNRSDVGQLELDGLIKLLKCDGVELAEGLVLSYFLYDEYGFFFLEPIAFRSGLTLAYSNSLNKDWCSLTQSEKEQVAKDFDFEATKESIEKVVRWIEEGEIIFTGELTDLGYVEYSDLRSKEDKKSVFQPTITGKIKSFFNKVIGEIKELF